MEFHISRRARDRYRFDDTLFVLSGRVIFAEYIRETWGPLPGKHFYRLLGGLDLIREEEKMRFAGPGPAQVYEFTG
jgi:hypothetical protein